MEIVGSEELLTDFEVSEVLNSRSYSSAPTLKQFDESMKSFTKAVNDSQKIIRNVRNESNWIPKSLRKQETKLELATLEKSRLKSSEGMIWVREQTLKYLRSSPGFVQSQSVNDKFLDELKVLEKEGNFSISVHDCLHLLNHRPTCEVELHGLIDDYAERVPTTMTPKLLALIEKLLPKPQTRTADEASGANDGMPGEVESNVSEGMNADHVDEDSVARQALQKEMTDSTGLILSAMDADALSFESSEQVDGDHDSNGDMGDVGLGGGDGDEYQGVKSTARRQPSIRPRGAIARQGGRK